MSVNFLTSEDSHDFPITSPFKKSSIILTK